MTADDDADCVEHEWGVAQLHLSVERGTEQVKRCTRCPAVAYVPDTGRATRDRLR